MFADPDQHVERRRVADQERPAASAPYSRAHPTVLLLGAAATAAVSVDGATAAVLAAILAVVVVVRHPAVLQRVRKRQSDTATARRPAARG